MKLTTYAGLGFITAILFYNKFDYASLGVGIFAVCLILIEVIGRLSKPQHL
ncbi:unnamed protein product [marine sediment metagenome]|uniref:Uncharacterized protein n=1 Tax=marine sediment metagenome TaxID=412755 RepID=X1V8B1_9ZZZZ